MQEEQHVEVLFRYHSDVLEEEVVETMWAVPVDEAAGLFRLDSIPFYGPPIATDDIFFAEHDADEEALTFREVREYSGNSIVQVIVMREPFGTTELRGRLMELGCPSEGLNDRFFVVEVPASVDYGPVKAFLSELAASEQIGYAEPVLSEEHSA
ncbi:MAG: DUF4265 domain-containing protein [Proteobacteria bacterium]|nr:MAG: DUF4265 domain-containing protein [Pseudomonadota bacterium]